MSQQLSDRALCITVTIGVINSAAQPIEKKWGHLSLIPAGYLVLKLGTSIYLLLSWYDGTPKVQLQSILKSLQSLSRVRPSKQYPQKVSVQTLWSL